MFPDFYEYFTGLVHIQGEGYCRHVSSFSETYANSGRRVLPACTRMGRLKLWVMRSRATWSSLRVRRYENKNVVRISFSFLDVFCFECISWIFSLSCTHVLSHYSLRYEIVIENTWVMNNSIYYILFQPSSPYFKGATPCDSCYKQPCKTLNRHSSVLKS